MKVIATRNSSKTGPDFVSYVGLSDELPTLISQADVVVSALPLIPATTNLFDAKMFARMKKTLEEISVRPEKGRRKDLRKIEQAIRSMKKLAFNKNANV